MKRYLLLTAILFGLIYNVQAQSVSGIVSSATERFSGAVIKNTGTVNQTISDGMGVFSIRAKKGDTLLTSRTFYKTDTLVYSGQSYLIIQLQPANRTLHEVTIKANQLSPLDIYEQNKKEYKDIYWKGDYSNMFGISVGTFAGVTINVDKLYNYLSKQGRDARKMQRTLTRDYHDDVIDRHFTKSMVTKVTGYDSSKLDIFMMKYRPTYDFIAKATDYDVIRYIKDKFALDMKEKNQNDDIVISREVH